MFSSLDYLSHRLPTPANCRSTYQHFRLKNHPKSASKMTWKWLEIYTGSHIASKMDSKAKKTLPSGPKVSPKRPLACPTAPQMPPDASRTPPEGLQNAPRTLPKRLRRDPTPPQRTLGASSEHPLAKISSKHVFSWCMQQNHTFDLPDGVKNHFQSTSQAQCKGCMWKQIEESGKKVYCFLKMFYIFVASFLLWACFGRCLKCFQKV